MAWTCSAAQAGQVTELYMMRLKCSRFDARNYPLLGKGSGLLMSSSSTSRWPSSCADLSPPGRPVRYMSALAALALPRTRGRTRTDDDSGGFHHTMPPDRTGIRPSYWQADRMEPAGAGNRHLV